MHGGNVDKKSRQGDNLAAATWSDTGSVNCLYYSAIRSNVKHEPRPMSAILAPSIATAQRNHWRAVVDALTTLVERDRTRACNKQN